MQKRLQVLADPAPIKSHTFFEMKISKKITSVVSSAFQKNLQRLDQPTLIIFFAFLEKNTTTGSSHFLSSNGQGYITV